MEKNDRDLSTSRDSKIVLDYSQYVARGRRIKALIDASSITDKTIGPPGQSLGAQAQRGGWANIDNGYKLTLSQTGEINYDMSQILQNQALPVTNEGVKVPDQILVDRKTWEPMIDSALEINDSYYNSYHGLIITYNM